MLLVRIQDLDPDQNDTDQCNRMMFIKPKCSPMYSICLMSLRALIFYGSPDQACEGRQTHTGYTYAYSEIN